MAVVDLVDVVMVLDLVHDVVAADLKTLDDPTTRTTGKEDGQRSDSHMQKKG